MGTSYVVSLMGEDEPIEEFCKVCNETHHKNTEGEYVVREFDCQYVEWRCYQCRQTELIPVELTVAFNDNNNNYQLVWIHDGNVALLINTTTGKHRMHTPSRCHTLKEDRYMRNYGLRSKCDNCGLSIEIACKETGGFPNRTIEKLAWCPMCKHTKLTKHEYLLVEQSVQEHEEI